jgi:hypothetical protein
MKIFLSCQQTPKILQEVVSHEVRASSPSFNKPSQEYDIKHYDVPVFGMKIPILIQALFRLPELEKIRIQHNMPLLEFRFDSFLQTKSHELMKYVSGSNHITRFLTSFQLLDPLSIKTGKDWEQFISNNQIPENWMDHLHQDEVLHLFSDAEKITNKFAIRWLSKILCAYTIPGCLTDVINLIHAMGFTSNNNIMELYFEIIHHSVNGVPQKELWIPNMLIHDGETDDMLCFILLKYLNPKIQIKMQVPPNEEIIKVSQKFEMIGWDIIVDKDSKNETALKNCLGL